MSKHPKIVWMEVDTSDKELPLNIADSAWELARICGTTENNVRSTANKARRGGVKRFRCVYIGGEE